MSSTFELTRNRFDSVIATGAPLLAWVTLLFAGAIWGVTFSLAITATEAGGHPLNIAFWQTLLGMILLLSVDLVRRRRLPLDRSHLLFYLVCGILGTALPSALYFYAARYLSAGVLSITIALVPMLTFVVALCLRVERLMVTRVLGVLLGIVAVAMIVLPESSLPRRTDAIWVIAAVLAAICYSIENMYIALRRPRGSDAVTVLCGMQLMGALLLMIVVATTGTFASPSWPLGQLEWSILGMAVINSAAYALFVYLVSSAGPVFASLMGYVVTLSGVMWGIFLFGEVHSAWIWGALVLMMIGITLVKPRQAG